MLIGNYIPPAPQPAVEQRVRRELKRIDPLLDIIWQPGWVFNPQQRQLEGRYVLVAWWGERDARLRDPDCSTDGRTYDILGAFCQDIHRPESIPEDPENVLGLLIELLASCDGERVSHLERFRAVHEANAQQQKWMNQQLDNEMTEAGEKAARQVFGKELF